MGNATEMHWRHHNTFRTSIQWTEKGVIINLLWLWYYILLKVKSRQVSSLVSHHDMRWWLIVSTYYTNIMGYSCKSLVPTLLISLCLRFIMIYTFYVIMLIIIKIFWKNTGYKLNVLQNSITWKLGATS